MDQRYPLDPATGAENAALLPWTNGNPATGVEGSYPPHQLITNVEAELLALIIASGQTPSGADMTQVLKAIRKLTAYASNYAIITASGTFTVPAETIFVEMITPGGGGGASGNGSGGGVAGNVGAGGGGGGYGFKKLTGLTVGAAVAVTIGAAGVGVTAGSGTTGGACAFGAYITGTGGGGGLWGENGNSASPADGGAGGVVSGADFAVPGGAGGYGGPNVPLGNNATQSDVQRIYNRGGVAAGGFSVPTFGPTGQPGGGYGTGGGGSSGGSGLIGGNGAPGAIIVRW
jgi:hypothetical protein